ncbi:MAG: hypothetical protein OEO79_02065 [Gemmatimonadota bacterium]|nr:hypothetical protein [Gemmatimonadota bacterium]
MTTRLIARSIAFVAAWFTATALLPTAASAQSAQQFSLQVSALGAIPFGGGLENVDAGAGWEAQLRINPSAFSIGAGVEQTFHSVPSTSNRDITFLGGFVEPRYVVDIGSDNVVLYLSARAALSQIKLQQGSFESTGTGYTLNGGGGLLFPLGARVNLDVGATMGYKDLGVVDIPTGGGGTATFDLGTGANVVGRVGLAIGLG